MRLVLFCHSIVSDWNHGNAHFLRGVAREMIARGHQVTIYEPARGWSLRSLVKDHGLAPVREFRRAYPDLWSTRYHLTRLDLDEALHGADLVLVHEWNSPALIRRLGAHRKRSGKYRLLFHDTHHRSVTDPTAISKLDLSGYDGVLAFGESVRERYLRAGWSRQVWVWHEGADATLFKPHPMTARHSDLIWIGNWGDEERTAELAEYLVNPVRSLGLSAMAYGVRYPDSGKAALERAGIRYGGWIPNYRVPELLASHSLTLHIPRRPYVRALGGVPTIRVFEALACGIPLICAEWRDTEGLFREGRDFLVARNGREMCRQMWAVLNDGSMAEELARRGRETVLSYHTCAHRVDQLLDIVAQLEPEPALQKRRAMLSVRA